MGYLVCSKCGGYYRLHEGESPDDFNENCECGGNLQYYDNLGGRLDKDYESTRTSKPPKERYFLPLLLILVSLECIFSVFYSVSIITFIGVIGLIFGLIFILIHIKGLYYRLYPNTQRIIYFLAAAMFLIEGGALVILWFQIDYFTQAKLGILIFIVLSIFGGISMILKTIDPDNPKTHI